MEKMKMQTVDGIARNIEKLEELFPNCVTETRGEDGAIKKAINFDVLRQLLSGEIAESPEAYDFTWVGKKAALAEAYKPIRKTLRPCPEESRNWDSTQNIYIEGDNLEVLKLLQENYLGKVKMIYIDPPYNTGSDSFVYNDNFRANDEEYDEEAWLFDEEGNKVFRENNASNPRFHSDWCSMIYSRLILARTLLADDGVIFISIDDNEQENFKKICNEIFGESNFVGQFVWLKKKKGSHLSKTIRNMTEYIVCYAKRINLIELFGEQAYSDKLQPLAKRTNSIKTLDFPKNIIKTTLKDGTYDEGTYGQGSSSIKFKKFSVKSGIVSTELQVTGPFVWSQEKLNLELQLGSIIYLSSKFGFNVLRSDQNEKIKRPSSLIDSKLGVGTNEDAYEEIIQLFEAEGIMSYPKPSSLIKYIINTRVYFEEDAIILDFFSGSATTAHAVMQLNAERLANNANGNLRYIMVQLPEACDEKSEAYKSGYKNICEIGKERIRRAGDKIKSENPLTTEGLDVGFRVFKVDESNMKDVYYGCEDLTQELLASTELNIKPDRTELDLLFSCVLEWGLPLSLPYKTEQIDGFTVHTYNDGDLIACFQEGVTEKLIIEIARRNPLRAVFRDSCFSNVASKINLWEIFKRFAPDAKLKTL